MQNKCMVYSFAVDNLRGPPAMFSISRDACSNSIAKLFGVCFYGVSHSHRAIYVAKWGVAEMCLCETKYQGGYRTNLRSAILLEKASCDRSDSITLSRSMGTLSGQPNNLFLVYFLLFIG